MQKGATSRPEGGQAPSEKAARKSALDYLNSGLGLMLITTLISTVLVPQYQQRSQELIWKRQIRAENARYHLSQMRECMVQFASAASLTSECFEAVRPLLEEESLPLAQIRNARGQLTAIQKRRLEQNTRVLGLLIHFPDEPAIRSRFDSYTRKATAYLDSLRRFALVREQSASSSLSQAEREQLERRAKNLAESAENLAPLMGDYQACARAMTQAIAAEEQRYEDLDL